MFSEMMTMTAGKFEPEDCPPVLLIEDEFETAQEVSLFSSGRDMPFESLIRYSRFRMRSGCIRRPS